MKASSFFDSSFQTIFFVTFLGERPDLIKEYTLSTELFEEPKWIQVPNQQNFYD